MVTREALWKVAACPSTGSVPLHEARTVHCHRLGLQRTQSQAHEEACHDHASLWLEAGEESAAKSPTLRHFLHYQHHQLPLSLPPPPLPPLWMDVAVIDHTLASAVLLALALSSQLAPWTAVCQGTAEREQ